MHFGYLSSTLEQASLASEKQFSNFATTIESYSTIGFPSVQTTNKDSNDSTKRDTKEKQPETMAAKYNLTAFATPGRDVDEDAMSQLSGVSIASTIFSGATDDRITILREAQKIVLTAVKEAIYM